MSSIRSLLALPVLVLSIGCDHATVTSNKQSPVSLPKLDETPPKAWTPPRTSISKEVIDRAEFYLANGMGDPRGKEFRAAKVVIGSIWGDAPAPQEVHGWIFPATADHKARLIDTAGLIHDTFEVGEKANLRKDFEEFFVARKAFPRGVGKVRVTDATVPILVVAGEIKLAEWLHSKTTETYPQLDFLSQRFDQAVTAHMRGDDATCYRVSKAIDRDRWAFEIRAQKQTEMSGGRGMPYRHLDVLPLLIKDTERRLRFPKPPIDLAGLKGKPTSERVRILIQALDQVSARQMGQPGGVYLIQDPIVAALVQEGAAAVEPLFKVIESDTRLTRSVSFGRDFFPGRNLITVKSAAYAAFCGIAETEEFPRDAQGKVDVSTLRQYWAKMGGKMPVERWFDTLADDQAGRKRWSEAAQRLFDRVGTIRSGSMTMTANPGPLKAELLRDRTNPSLAELLEKRAREIAAGEGDTSPIFNLLPALEIANDLGKWDSKAAQPVLRELSRQALDLIGSDQMDFYTMKHFVLPALEVRAKAGDAETWGDYMAFLEKLPNTRFRGEAESFRPMVEHLDEPGMRAAMAPLFLDPESKWSLDQTFRKMGAGYGHEIALSPLLGIKEFRERVVKLMRDGSVIGEISLDPKGVYRTNIGGQISGSSIRPDQMKDPFRPKPWVKLPYRVKDNVALALVRLTGAPPFQPYWPLAKRDAAIESLAKLIERRGEKIVEAVPHPNNWKEFRTNR